MDNKIKISMDDIMASPSPSTQQKTYLSQADYNAESSFSSAAMDAYGSNTNKKPGGSFILHLLWIVPVLALLLFLGLATVFICLSNGTSGTSGSGFIPDLGVNHKAAIQKVLVQFSEISAPDIQENDDLSPDQILDEYANDIHTYITQLRQINLDKTPNDFAAAFTEYIHAYESYEQHVMQHPYFGSMAENIVEGFIRGLLGDPTGGVFVKEEEQTNFKNTAVTLENQINIAFQKIETTALKYGIR